MSALSGVAAWFRRVFGGTGRVIKEVFGEVFVPALREVQRSGAKTDEERREIVKDLVVGYLSIRFPAYAWLADTITDAVFDAVRRRLK